ncbi:MAG: hypothetical protein ABIU63_09580 [Chitinophagaceae bacterium]
MKKTTDTSKINQLISERTRLRAALDSVERALMDLNFFSIEYLDWKQKAMDFMELSNVYIKSAEVLEWVFAATPERLGNKALRRKYITALSVALNSLNKEKIIKTFRIPSTQGHFYGLPGWFGRNGSLKKEFYSTTLRQRYGNAVLKIKAR